MTNTSQSPTPLAVVTGSGNGIGFAFAQQLASLGYDLALLEADAEADAEARQKLTSEFPNCQIMGVVGDVSDHQTWGKLIDELAGRSVSLLVNNAGTLHGGAISESQPEDLRHVVEVNLIGMLFGCQAVVPHLAKSSAAPLPSGLLNVASIFASISPPGFSAYNASKAGVIGLSETLLGELRPQGLSVTVVLPGLVTTGLFERGRYTNEQYLGQVNDYLINAELTPEKVARQALAAFKQGRFEVPIGKKAAWYWRLKRWMPQTLLKLVSKQAHEQLKNLAPPQ